MPTLSPKPGASNLLALVAGFGGLLAMMAFAEIDGVRALQGIERANDEIREDFLLRTRLLERIRGDVYVSGTYVRDYLLEPEAGKAEGHRYSLLETRHDMDAALAQYGALIHARERQPFQALTAALAEYWRYARPRLFVEHRRSASATASRFCATRSFRGAWRCWESPTRSAR